MHLRKITLILIIISVFFLCNIVYAQKRILTVAVLVNSLNKAGYNINPNNPGEFQRYPERYLEHLQVPYEIIDVSIQSPLDLSNRQLIIVGHKDVNLPIDWQNNIVNAVKNGTGLVNLDWATDIGKAYYIQEIFGATGSHVGLPDTSIIVPKEVAPGGINAHYITALQMKFLGDPAGDFVYKFHPNKNGVIKPVSCTVLENAKGTVIAKIGSSPLILATSYGKGRALHFGTLKYLKADRFGFLQGIDDLFWRSLVWAARKPFIVRGYPHLWAVQMDDTLPGWGYRIKDCFDTNLTGKVASDGTGGPWKVTGYVFTENLPPGSPERTSVISDIRKGYLKVSPHAFFGSCGDLYWGKVRFHQLSDEQWLENIGRLEKWIEGKGKDDKIKISTSLVPHFWNLSDNLGYDLWHKFGFRYITEIKKPGFPFIKPVRADGAERLHMRPFWLYELPPKTHPDENYPFFFADDYIINSRKGLPPITFFCFATQVINLNRYPGWHAFWPNPSFPVDFCVDQFKYYTWRLWSSLAPVQIYTHDNNDYVLSTPRERRELIKRVSLWLNAHRVKHVFMDELGDYIYARTKSVLTKAELNGDTVKSTFTGNAATADGKLIETELLVFMEDDEGASVKIPGFVGGAEFSFPLPRPAPVIQSISPNKGTTDGNISATIKGKNFYNITGVYIGDKPVLDFNQKDSPHIDVIIPSGKRGFSNVIVNTNSSSAILYHGFKYTMNFMNKLKYLISGGFGLFLIFLATRKKYCVKPFFAKENFGYLFFTVIMGLVAAIYFIFENSQPYLYMFTLSLLFKISLITIAGFLLLWIFSSNFWSYKIGQPLDTVLKQNSFPFVSASIFGVLLPTLIFGSLSHTPVPGHGVTAVIFFIILFLFCEFLIFNKSFLSLFHWLETKYKHILFCLISLYSVIVFIYISLNYSISSFLIYKHILTIFSVIPLFLIMQHYLDNISATFLSTVYLFYSAIGFFMINYHNDNSIHFLPFVFIPLTFYFFIKDHFKLFIIFFIATILSNPNPALGITMALFGISALFLRRTSKWTISPIIVSILICGFAYIGMGSGGQIINSLEHIKQFINIKTLGYGIWNAYEVLKPVGVLPIFSWANIFLIPTIIINMLSKFWSRGPGLTTYQSSLIILSFLFICTAQAIKYSEHLQTLFKVPPLIIKISLISLIIPLILISYLDICFYTLIHY